MAVCQQENPEYNKWDNPSLLTPVCQPVRRGVFAWALASGKIRTNMRCTESKGSTCLDLGVEKVRSDGGC
jgi:hypothetical protein